MDEDGDIDNEEEPAIEEVTLDQVEEDGEVLALMDSRRLLVNPDDINTTALWFPTSTLMVLETNEDEDGLFNLSILLQGTDQEIRARWLHH